MQRTHNRKLRFEQMEERQLLSAQPADTRVVDTLHTSTTAAVYSTMVPQSSATELIDTSADTQVTIPASPSPLRTYVEYLREPDVQVVRIEGPNITAFIRSPHDASNVRIEGGGLLSSQNIEHPGGTLGTTATVTFNILRGGGRYTLILRDGNGVQLDALTLVWNTKRRMLSLADETDRWTAEESAAALQLQEFTLQSTGKLEEDIQREMQLESFFAATGEQMQADMALQQRTTSINFSSAAVRGQFLSELWQQSGLAITGSQAEQMFYAANPKYNGANIQKTIDAEWRRNPRARRGQIADMVLRTRSDLLTRVRQGCNAYNSDMQNFVFPAAINVFMKLREGKEESALLKQFQGTLSHLSGHITAQLFQYTTFRAPSANHILQAARRGWDTMTPLYMHYQSADQKLLGRAQQELDRKHEAQRIAALEASLRLEYAQGPESSIPKEIALANQQQWVEHMTLIRAQQRQEPAEQNRALERAARLAAAALQQQTDARVQVVLAGSGGSNIQRERVAEHDAMIIAASESQLARMNDALYSAMQEHMHDPDAAAELAGRTLLAQADMLLTEALFAEADGGFLLQRYEDALQEARLEAARMASGQRLQDALHWYDPNAPLTTYAVRHDSMAGRIFKGLVQQLMQQQQDAYGQARIAAMLEQITDIPAEKVLACLRPDGRVSAAALQELFTVAGYGSIFLQETPAATLPAQVLSTNVHQQGDTLRVRADVATQGMALRELRVYRNGETGQAEPLAASRNRLFVEVPVQKLGLNGETSLTVVAVLENGTTVAKNTGTFLVQWNGSQENGATARALAEEIIGASLWQQMTPVQQAAAADALDFGHLDLQTNNGKIIDYLMREYLRSGALQFDAQKMEWRGEAYFDDPSTKEDDLVGQCKYWVQLNVINHATGILVPKNDPGRPWAWQPSHNILEVVQRTSTATSYTPLHKSGAIAGDIIQYQIGSSNVGHTVIIAKISDDDVWVFDANYHNDLTPRLHKISLNEIESSGGYSVYRVI